MGEHISLFERERRWFSFLSLPPPPRSAYFSFLPPFGRRTPHIEGDLYLPPFLSYKAHNEVTFTLPPPFLHVRADQIFHQFYLVLLFFHKNNRGLDSSPGKQGLSPLSVRTPTLHPSSLSGERIPDAFLFSISPFPRVDDL